MPLMPMMPKSTRNWRMKSMVGLADDAAVARAHDAAGDDDLEFVACRLRMLATCRLLVMTRRPRWRSSALATSSVVVPMLMNSEASLGMCVATQPRDPPLLLETAAPAGS